MKKLDKIGSQTALLFGVPTGSLFSFIVLFLSLFPPMNFGLALIGGKIFWHPLIWAALLPITFICLLWLAGRKIKHNLDIGLSLIKTSFFFTLYINSRFFTLILILFIAGNFIFNLLDLKSLFQIIIPIGMTLIIFVISTVITTFTIGLIVVKTTKAKIEMYR